MRIVFILIIAGLLAACATTPPSSSDQANVCDIFEGRKAWYRAAAKAEQNWGTPIALQMAIIKAESNFQSDARPPRGQRRNLGLTRGLRPSSARGYAQALDGTWEEYQSNTGNNGANRENFADATDFIGWYTSRAARSANITFLDARAHYLAYHEGAGGYARGTWRSKDWLISRANKVASDTQMFNRQLSGCEKRLKRRGLFGS